MSRWKKSEGVVEREILPQMDSLYRFCLYLTRERASAEDLTQETMLKAVAAIDSYQEGTNSKAWLLRIATNTHLNRVRRKGCEVELQEGVLPETEAMGDSALFTKSASPEECFVHALTRSQVRDAVEKLPAEFRAVVVLADLEGLAYREIAEVLSCPIGTVMSRLHRGRRMLRGMLLSYAREIGLVGAGPGTETGTTEARGSGTAAGSSDAVKDGSMDRVAVLSTYRKASRRTEDGEEVP